MALITTTGSLIRQYNAFSGLSATERSQSGIARAEVVYYTVNDSWPAPGAGNFREYQSGQIDLPKDFGYVLTDAYVSVDCTGDDVDAEMNGVLRIFPGGILGPNIHLNLEALPSRMGLSATQAVGDVPVVQYNSTFPSFGSQGRIVYRLADYPKALLYPFGANTYTTDPNPATVWEYGLSERYENGSGYDVNAYFRFLQYDIDQSYNYVVQSPPRS